MLNFYRNLLGSATSQLPYVNIEVMKVGATLNRQQQLKLIAPVTKMEVIAALEGIDDQKAPDIDGFNAFFYKKVWHIGGPEIEAAVMEFFNSLVMCKVINCTTVTLIPKVQHASSVKEFRPILYCTILYKIISKILTTRLQTVMDEFIGSSQAAFVPGRIISDNIILSQELVKGNSRKGISPRCMLKIDMKKAYNVQAFYLVI